MTTPNVTSKERHYWAKPKGHQIANWHKEKKEAGVIASPEMPLRFSEHMRSTSDPKMIKFIEASTSFKDGKVVRVDSVAAGQILTEQVNQLRRVTTIKSTDETVVQPVG